MLTALCLLALSAEIPIWSLTRVGSATLAQSTLRLTTAAPNQSGAAWHPQPLQLGPSFDTSFTFRLTRADSPTIEGSDGFAFVIQNFGPTALGGRGSSGGFSLGRGDNPPDRAIPRSLAIFFDTHRNREESDPSSNSLGIFTNADAHFPPRRLAIQPRLPFTLNDGKPHTARIHYQLPALQISLDGQLILSLNITLQSNAHLGFTASTGKGYQTHEILNWSFTPSQPQVSSTLRFHDESCLPGFTLCTPSQPKLTELQPNRWHIILPAQSPSITIPNSRNLTPRLQNLSGTVCWLAPTTLCSGPESRIKIRKAPNTIRLSIDAPPATAAEGFFEFEVLFVHQ